MTLQNAGVNNQDWDRLTLGDARAFYRQVVMPQIFVFVCLIVIGSLRAENVYSFFAKLSPIFYLILVNIVVQTYLKSFSARFMAVHLAGLSALVSLVGIFLEQIPVLGVYLPITLVLLTLWLFVLPAQVVGRCVLPMLSILIIYVGISALGKHFDPVEHAVGWMLVVFAGLTLMLKNMLIDRSAKTNFDSFVLNPTQALVSPAPGATRRERDRRVRETSMPEAMAVMAVDLKNEFTGLLPMICVFSAVLALAPTLALGVREVRPALVAAGILLTQLILIRVLRQREKISDVYFTALIVGVLNLFWWCIAASDRRISALTPDLVLICSMLTLGFLPWPATLGVLLSAICLLQVALRVPFSPDPVVLLLWAVLCLPLLIRSSSALHMGSMTRAGMSILNRAIESALGTMALIRLLARYALLLSGARSALVILDGQQAEVVTLDDLQVMPEHAVAARGFVNSIQEYGRDEGILASRILGQQYQPAMQDWFGVRPKRLFFSRLRAILDDREADLWIIVPISRRQGLVSVGSLTHALSGLALIVRNALSAARSRFLSSDVLLVTQQSVSHKEQEFNQIVHLVNNVVQDISVYCDSLRKVFSQPLPENTTEASGQLNALEDAARNLSAGVSDIKLLKEMSRVRLSGKMEVVDFESVWDEIAAYARHRATRRQEQLEIKSNVQAEIGVQVVSREFLETGLRLLLRLAGARVAHSGNVHIEAWADEHRVWLRLKDSGPEISPEIRQLLNLSSSDTPIWDLEHETLSAVGNMIRLSRGTVQFEDVSPEWPNSLLLSFERITLKADLPIMEGLWVLLVDDNPQVTSFYARVAEALNLKYFTAASVEAAKLIIAEHGKPRLVVTDLQLGDGSGLDLVRQLRQEFGADLPVIVVSGHTGEGISQEIASVGATKYLAKPVSRGKLFAEIRGILSV